MNLERQKENFKDHIATFTDYGNIKILDFKKPNSSEFRIRFLFEEDYCRLHISGDLGELIASNYSNMVYEKFSDFVNDVGYFEEKIDCHSRPIYTWDEEKAKQDIIEHMKEYGFYEDIVEDRFDFESEEDAINEFLEDVMGDFDNHSGIGTRGFDRLSAIDSDIWEAVSDFGKERTGILELYMLAFKLAQKQLK